jgi:hypothetical protein
MITLRAGYRRALLAIVLLATAPNMALAGGDVPLERELERLMDIQRRVESLPAYQAAEDLRRQISALRMNLEAHQRNFAQDYSRWSRDEYFEEQRKRIESEIESLQRQLDEAQKAIVNFREAISGDQRERFFSGVRHRLATFTFDDPHATGLGDPISFLLSKKLLFSTRVTSFAIVNYRQGADRDSSSNLAYFDRVDAITKDQKYLLAIWGRISRIEGGIRIDSFLQVPGDANKTPYVRTIRLPEAMGGGRLTARLKPDRILLQRLDIARDKISLLRTAAEQVATLRASPAATAPVTGHLGTDASGPTHRIVGSQGTWIQLQLADGSRGWTSVDQFCTDECRALLDVVSFANDVVAFTSDLPARSVSKSLTREAESMSQQLAALASFYDNPKKAAEIAERWLRGGSGGTPPGGAGFANLLAVARVKSELNRMNAREQNFDRIRLGRQTIERIANQLAEASVADPSDIDAVENLAVLFAYLGDDRRRGLALEIAANLKAKAH